MADTTGRSSSTLAKVLFTIAIIGAINWGLIGFFNFNLVDAIFGGGSREEVGGISRIIYALVGLAGLASLAFLPRIITPNRAIGAGEGTAFKRRAHV